MSITIQQLLDMPSFQGVEICAGKSGLSNIVSSISVLEYAKPNYLQEELFDNKKFQGGEIVISGLISIKDDVDAQCLCIKRLHEAGEVGLILYYVGIFLKRIDPRVLTLADELGFPIICMPKNRMDLRYSEVIQEVMEKIVKDRMADTYFVSEMLERISHLPKYQRSMDSVLRMLSDRTQISYYIIDEKNAVLNEASWPKKPNFKFHDIIQSSTQRSYHDIVRYQNFWIQKLRIQNEDSHLYLIMIKEGSSFEQDVIAQSQEIIQLFINIWSQNHGAKRSDELIRAILQDEPVKMRHLAKILHIDVAEIHSMWMLRPKEINSQDLLELQNLCEEFLHIHYHQVMSAIIKDAVIVFMGNEKIHGNESLLKDMFLTKLHDKEMPAIIWGSYSLKDTSQARSAYMNIIDYQGLGRIIYPKKEFFTLSEIEFTKDMKKHIDEGESHIKDILSLLDFHTRDEKQKEELLTTLCVYLLDGDMHMQTTADILFLHKNTIKYRIQLLQEKLHTSIQKLPEALDFYKACAIYRILHQR